MTRRNRKSFKSQLKSNFELWKKWKELYKDLIVDLANKFHDPLFFKIDFLAIMELGKREGYINYWWHPSEKNVLKKITLYNYVIDKNGKRHRRAIDTEYRIDLVDRNGRDIEVIACACLWVLYGIKYSGELSRQINSLYFNNNEYDPIEILAEFRSEIIDLDKTRVHFDLSEMNINKKLEENKKKPKKLRI